MATPRSRPRSVLVGVLAAVGLAVVIQAFVVRPYRIPSGSMEPTLAVGDRVLALRFWYRLKGVKRGDIVTFHPPGSGSDVRRTRSGLAEDVVYIKRVVGLPTEWVGARGGVIWICPRRPPPRVVPVPNCRSLDEPYLGSVQQDFSFRRVPDGHLFVMGDNRGGSDDSRVFGPIAQESLLGRAAVRYWPPWHAGLLRRAVHAGDPG